MIAGQAVPEGVVVAGYEADNAPLLVGRAHHERDIIPGKFVPSRHTLYIPWGCGEHAKQQFELFCSDNFKWVAAANGLVPPHAVAGGKTSDGETLFIGRAHFRGSLIPGKIHSSHRTLYIGYEGAEIAIEEYEVLVEEK